MPACGVMRRGQLAGAHEQVVRQARLLDRGKAALDVVAPQPVGIGLVVDLVPHPDQLVSAIAGSQALDRGRDVNVGEVDPADDARDQPMPGSDGEELDCLADARNRLHEN